MAMKVSGITVERLSEDEIKTRGVRSWPIWEKEVSQFDWTYDSVEHCLFLEGEVTIKTAEGETAIQKGDYVSFPKGLSCQWNVKKAVRKHYRFE